MSIINTMLQDLDKRNGRPGGEAVAGDAVRSTPPTSPWHVRRSVLFGLAGFAGVALSAGWWLQQHRSGAIDKGPIVAVAAPVPVIANAPQVAAPLPPAASAPAVAVAPPVAAASAAAPVAAVQHAKVAAPAPAPAPLSTPAAVPAPASKPVPLVPAVAADKVEAAPPKLAAVSAKTTGAKTYSAKQMSANLVGEAIVLEQEGRQEEAKMPLQRALAANPLDIQARQMLIRLQMDSGRGDEARALLAEGQRLHPELSDFTLALARLKVESGDSGGAIQLLEAGNAAARDEPQYHALLAALLLRSQRYDEAVQHYLVSLRSDPANVSWLVGVGVALEGVGKPVDAAEAYRRADGASNLTPEMAAFLSERLARLRR